MYAPVMAALLIYAGHGAHASPASSPGLTGSSKQNGTRE